MQMFCIDHIKPTLSILYKGAYFFAPYYPHEVSKLVHIKDDDRQMILHTEGKGGHIHYPEILGDTFLESYYIKFFSSGVFFGIGRIDAVNTCAFQDDLCVDLDGAER